MGDKVFFLMQSFSSVDVFDERAGVYHKISICFLSHLTTYHWRKTVPVLLSAAQNSFKPISTTFLWTYQSMPPSQQWMIDINGKPSSTARRHIFQNSDKLRLSTDVTAPDLTLSVKFVWFWRCLFTTSLIRITIALCEVRLDKLFFSLLMFLRKAIYLLQRKAQRRLQCV